MRWPQFRFSLSAQSFVRMETYGLVHAGYTPKWLDEFSNIPRHAIPNAKPPMKGDAAR